MVQIPFTLEVFEYYLLILVRISAFVYVAPFFSLRGIPHRVKIGFSMVVAIMLFFILPESTLDYGGEIGYAVVIIKEAITGVLIGFAASICNYIILFAGRMIDTDIGLAMATVFDPTTNQQSSITGSIYNYFIMMLLILSDMHLFIFRSLVDCYQVIPVNKTVFDYDHLYESMLTFFGDYMVIGFMIMLPVFVCIMLLNIILGIMAKVAPQMNMFAVGIQLKIVVGFIAILLTIGLLPTVADYIFTEMRRMMVLFVEGMF